VIDSPASAAALLLVGVVGYFVGSISSGYIVGRMYRNVDLRKVGSGSTGATNTFRTLGTGAGLLVAIFDILKGSLAVVFAQLVFPEGSSGRPLAEALAASGVPVEAMLLSPLSLEDIDWRGNRLRIRRSKGGDTSWYPLHPEVGEAIADYVRRGRPVHARRPGLHWRACGGGVPTPLKPPAPSPYWPAGLTRCSPGRAAVRPTEVIPSGASSTANRVHAADQPSWVSGHHSSGCEREPATVQIPK